MNKTAARNEERPRSEMKAELMGMIDAAIKGAPDYNQWLSDVREYGEKEATDRYTKYDDFRAKGEKFAPDGHSRPKRTFRIPGAGTFTVNNTVRQLLKFKAAASASPGFRAPRRSSGLTERATDTLDRRSKDAAIANMIDEGDFTAAIDYAEAVGVKLTKGLRERFDKMAADTDAYEAAKAEGKPPP